MAEFKVELPKMGESVAEATITTWLKAVGDEIEEDEPIVEIATCRNYIWFFLYILRALLYTCYYLSLGHSTRR